MRWLNRQDIRPSSCPPTPQTSMPSNTTLPSSKNSGQTHRHTPRLTTLLNHMEIIWHDYNALAIIFRGGVLAAQGQASEGIVQIRNGLEARRAISADAITQPRRLALLADAYRQAGQPDEGLRTVKEEPPCHGQSHRYSHRLVRPGTTWKSMSVTISSSSSRRCWKKK